MDSHLEEAATYAHGPDGELFRLYVLNPRIADEQLEAYRPVIKEMFGDANPTVADLIAKAKEVRIYDELNSDVTSVTPASVARIMTADSRSRDIFFVAMARTFGIPSRLDPFTGKVQYHNGNEWIDVAFSASASEAITPKGSLKLAYTPTKIVPDPKYGSHFTIARMGDDGTPWPEKGRETWITSRMAHVYSIGHMLGGSEYGALADAALKGLQGELHDRTHGGWYAGRNLDGSIMPAKQCYAHAFVILAASSALLAGRDGAEELLNEALALYASGMRRRGSPGTPGTQNSPFWTPTGALTPICTLWRRFWPSLTPLEQNHTASARDASSTG